MLKILQDSLQQYMNQELPDVQAGSREGRGIRNQMVNIHWITEKARKFQKNICLFDYTKAFDCVECNKLWKILREMGTPEHLTYLLRNLYEGHEAIVTTRHETTNWSKTGKGVHQGCMLSPGLFNFYAEYIFQNAGPDEAQAGIKTARRNINNLRYTHDTTLMAESKEELKSLLIKVKKSWLKIQYSKNKDMASCLIASQQIDGEKMETVTDFYFLGLQNHCK